MSFNKWACMKVSEVSFIIFSFLLLISCESSSDSKKRSCTYNDEPIDCSFFDKSPVNPSAPKPAGINNGSESDSEATDHNIVNNTKSTILSYRTDGSHNVLPPASFEDEILISNPDSYTDLAPCDQLPNYLRYAESVEQKLLDLSKAYLNYKKDVKDKEWLEDQINSTYESYTEKIQAWKKSIVILEDKIEDHKDNINSIEALIRSDRMIQKSYENILNQAAGKADIEFVSSWDSDIRKLSVDNPGLTFKRAPMKKNLKFELNVADFEKLPALNMVTGFMDVLEISLNKGFNTIAKAPTDFKTIGNVNFFSVCPMTKDINGEALAELKDLKILIKYTNTRN